VAIANDRYSVVVGDLAGEEHRPLSGIYRRNVRGLCD